MKYFLSYRANVVLSAAETAAAAFLQNQSIPRNFFGGYKYATIICKYFEGGVGSFSPPRRDISSSIRGENDVSWTLELVYGNDSFRIMLRHTRKHYWAQVIFEGGFNPSLFYWGDNLPPPLWLCTSSPQVCPYQIWKGCTKYFSR